MSKKSKDKAKEKAKLAELRDELSKMQEMLSNFVQKTDTFKQKISQDLSEKDEEQLKKDLQDTESESREWAKKSKTLVSKAEKLYKEVVNSPERVEHPNGFTRNQSHTSSKIATSRNDLTATQLKIFYQCSTLIEPTADEYFKIHIIDVKNFCEKMGINHTNRAYIVDTLRRILKKTFEIQTPNGDYVGYTIFSMLGYKHKEQKIEIRFNNDMIPFLLELKEQFTKIQQVQYINNFNSKYAIRFYTLLKDYRKMGHRDFEIDALIQMFMLPKSYRNYDYLNKKVLQPAISEINEKSDLWVDEPKIIGKEGKKITKIRLTFGNRSEKISNDFCQNLLKMYRKLKTFNVFVGCFWQGENDKEPVRITEIETNRGNYYQFRYGNSNELSSLGTPNRDDFVNNLIKGIYKALQYYYEREKQSQLPVEEWQSEQDELTYFKELYNKWRGASSASHSFADK